MAEALYIHVPFCVRKCLYCGFPSVPYEDGLASGFAEALKREMSMRAGGGLGTVYVGGGTPTVLPPGLLGGIIKAVGECFDLLPDVEFTVEANPGTVDVELAGMLRELGVNRLSIGVQSFDGAELAALGRTHTAEDAERAATGLGFENFSLDLIYGIPGQGMDGWLRTLDRAAGFGPRHVSAYELTPEEGTPLYALVEEGRVLMPGEDLALGMFDLAGERLGARGLERYEISNYAVPGSECRHNLNYWQRGEYIGLGPGAHSFGEGRRRKNTADVRRYVESIASGIGPVEEDVEVSREEALREHLFLGLRMTRGVDLGFFRDALGLDLVSASARLVEDGLVWTGGGRMGLTDRGLALFNPVVVALFEALGL